MASPASPAARIGSFAPFRVGAFRALWLAGIVSNIGAWMQTVGAQWTLVEQGSPTWVIALVQTAAAAPVLLLAIPAGVLGEFVNKRTLLIVVQSGQLVVVTVLTAMSVAHAVTPTLLLALTLLLGAGSALQLPAYQAIVPDVVPKADIPAAAALSSIGVNVARAIGPAAAGLVVAQFGVAAVFALNAVSFAVFLATLVLWRTYTPRPRRPETFVDATVAGLRYVRHSPVIRSLYVRLGLFLLPASSLWALLPSVAHDELGLGSEGYGILLAALGAGSIVGAFVLPAARVRLGTNALVLVSVLVFGLGSAGLAWAPGVGVSIAVLALSGLAWLGVIATINATVQSFLPPWVRTRGLSVYQLVLYGGTALGSTLVGIAAQYFGLRPTLLLSGGLMICVAVSLLVKPLNSAEGIGRDIVPFPLTDVPPVTSEQPAHGDDEVLVLVRYTVDAASHERFLEHMALVEESRRRTGARRWQVYADPGSPNEMIEAFTLGSWQEYANQQTDRETEYDAQVLEAAAAFSSTTPRVERLLSAPHKTRHLRRYIPARKAR
jgi:MFS family permease/quinol monooxygenase YgiN